MSHMELLKKITNLCDEDEDDCSMIPTLFDNIITYQDPVLFFIYEFIHDGKTQTIFENPPKFYNWNKEVWNPGRPNIDSDYITTIENKKDPEEWYIFFDGISREIIEPIDFEKNYIKNHEINYIEDDKITELQNTKDITILTKDFILNLLDS